MNATLTKKSNLSMVFSFVFLLHNLMYSQQEAQYSMYMFNPLSVNPAYAGTRNALSVIALYRNQWTGFKGAPKTMNLTLHSPIKYSNLSLGMSIINDQLGTTKTNSFKGDVAYKIRLNRKKHYLSFGINAGLDLFSAQQTKASINDENDPTYTNLNNKTLFNAGAGIYYYGKRHYLGLSTPKLIENSYNGSSSVNFKQIKHYYLMGGIVVPISSVVQFKPSFVVKAVENAPLSADINASFLFYDKIWVGAMYRLKESCGLNVVLYLNDYLTLGYSYDYTLGNLRKYNTGSHELMLGFDLNRKQRSFKTPRYF